MEDRLVEFAVRIGGLAGALPSTKFGKHIASQIIRSGSSPAPNYGETSAAESRDDFVHKLAIVFKELRETRVWLKMIRKAKMLSPSRLGNLFEECDHLCNIVGKSLKTARANKAKPLPKALPS